ncbi:ABC transporter permease [Leptospirillum ferriphilum]|jgi:putative ABC transport system permease protein|uniref:ABC transporter permease n=2 Tax=Leptospirillum ferriphilum TaxID=178606 RepID=A0A1V3STM5_9BACT|nr:ABC transporter permease [Leptospirillum ferriphilum]AFS54472.1 putative ABC transporter, permease protein [Leptospirillum ferriphilum ML-04]EAY58251.1 MAG: putative ABC transporter, permease protein [Leptospirillum rubarum]OOH71439.1 ABC transporter permease [Leptospirillum ferriphilum]
MNIAGLAFRSLARNPFRTILTMLGIVIGTAAVILLVSLGMGARHLVLDSINNLGPNLLIVIPGSVTDSGAQVGGGTDTTLTLDDARAIREGCPSVLEDSAALRTAGQVLSGAANWSTVILGTESTYLAVRNWELSKGSFFTEKDVRAMSRVAILGRKVARRLFGFADPVGKWVQINHSPFQVIGILSPKGQSPMGMDQDDMVVIPITTLQTQIMGVTYVGVILANAVSTDGIETAKQEISRLLRIRHHIPPDGRPDFSVNPMSDITRTANRLSLILTVLLAAIASISLLVGGIGIMNIMLVSVRERTREIGIRMAIGARPGDIVTQFLVESAVLSLLGGLTGILLGAGGIFLFRDLVGWPAPFPIGFMTATLLFSGGIGVVFGLYPAVMASRLDPMVALRYE